MLKVIILVFTTLLGINASAELCALKAESTHVLGFSQQVHVRVSCDGKVQPDQVVLGMLEASLAMETVVGGYIQEGFNLANCNTPDFSTVTCFVWRKN
jgi:hypothetical protein